MLLCYTLINGGADGIRTRDLWLDRAGLESHSNTPNVYTFQWLTGFAKLGRYSLSLQKASTGYIQALVKER
jgi:hypothetical protein